MRKLIAILPFGLLVWGCTDFTEPDVLDPSPVWGCYVAAQGPSLSVQSNGVRVGQSSEILPLRYEQHKVGMVLAIPMIASVDRGTLEIRSGDTHLYRVLGTDEGPVIRVAANPDGTLWRYERRSQDPC